MRGARNTRRPGWLRPAVLVSCLVAVPAVADVELVLEDDQVVSGLDVELKDGQYLLELRTGSVLAVPAELVRELRLTGGNEREREIETPNAPTGLRVAEPEVLAGPPDPIPLPTRSEQIAAFRSGTSRFARGVIDPDWHPQDGWMRPGINDFNPARWFQAPIDSNWSPVPAYTTGSDVTEFSPVEWRKGVFDQRWYPQDGFARRDLWAGGDRSPFAGRFWVERDAGSGESPE